MLLAAILTNPVTKAHKTRIKASYRRRYRR
jgi:hypothetical protein